MPPKAALSLAKSMGLGSGCRRFNCSMLQIALASSLNDGAEPLMTMIGVLLAMLARSLRIPIPLFLPMLRSSVMQSNWLDCRSCSASSHEAADVPEKPAHSPNLAMSMLVDRSSSITRSRPDNSAERGDWLAMSAPMADGAWY